VNEEKKENPLRARFQKLRQGGEKQGFLGAVFQSGDRFGRSRRETAEEQPPER